MQTNRASRPQIALLIPQGGLRDTFLPPDVMAALGEIGDIRGNPLDRQYTPGEMADALDGADISISGWGCPVIGAQALRRADRLRLVAHTGGTVAPIVSPELFARGIHVISGNRLYAESVAEGAVAYMLAGLRRIPFYGQAVQDGGWSEVNSPFEGLLDQTVGLVGFGAIARCLAPMLAPFRARVLAYDPYVDAQTFADCGVERVETLEELLPQCKIVSLHMPRTKATYHMITRALVDLMPDGALLVNTARGSVIDEDMLAGVLKTGRIRAVLDVYEEEPLPPGSPLRGLENVLLMPHMGGPTMDRRPRVTMALMEDMRRMLAGQPLAHEIGQAYALSMTNDYVKVEG